MAINWNILGTSLRISNIKLTITPIVFKIPTIGENKPSNGDKTKFINPPILIFLLENKNYLEKTILWVSFK